MKVMVSKKEYGFSVYIPKKDLEAKVVKTDPAFVFGGQWDLEGGLSLYLEPLPKEPKFPITLEAKKL